MQICIIGKAWHLLSHDHDVIKIGPFEVLIEEKQRFVQPTLCSMIGVYDIYALIARYV